MTPAIKIAAGVAAWMTGITLLHYRPWQAPERPVEPGRQSLSVGFLPVT